MYSVLSPLLYCSKNDYAPPYARCWLLFPPAGSRNHDMESRLLFSLLYSSESCSSPPFPARLRRRPAATLIGFFKRVCRRRVFFHLSQESTLIPSFFRWASLSFNGPPFSKRDGIPLSHHFIVRCRITPSPERNAGPIKPREIHLFFPQVCF